jgi:hypothetical protein
MVGAALTHVAVRPPRRLPDESTGSTTRGAAFPIPTVSVAGTTLTAATGTGVTVILAVAVRPSLDAVIVAVPAERPVTTPVDDTVATALADEVHVTNRPVIATPLAPNRVAVSGTERPTSMEAVVGATATRATAKACTAITAVPVTPATVALILTVPGVIPWTVPRALTEATVVLLERQTIGRPRLVSPEASSASARRVKVEPTPTPELDGVTRTTETGGGDTVT